ncbi:hypothetical protein V494_07003 [Pseudogymnoascus sp. VKM F-4513 (FW-928)]|nr:hypothetical protein V494_07003 [Pseudogymnoascus sp. VKM F-4513 (FW-928)]
MIVTEFCAVASRRKGPAGNTREDQQGIAPDGEGDNQDQRLSRSGQRMKATSWWKSLQLASLGHVTGILGRWDYWGSLDA